MHRSFRLPARGCLTSASLPLRRSLAATAIRVALGALLVAAADAVAQEPGRLTGFHHTSWLVGRELPVNGISRIARSSDGYLWLGSTAGLVRFDGVRFVVVDGSTEAALASGIPGRITPQLVDRTGRMWIARPDGGIVAYRAGRFEVVVAPAEGERADPVDIMVQDRRGRIWARAATRVLELKGGSLVRAGFPREAPDTGILRMVADTGGGLWLATRTQGMWRVSDRQATRLAPPTGQGGPQAIPLLQHHDGTLWVGAPGIWRWGSDQRLRALAGLRCGCTMTVAPDGTLWAGALGAGVFRIRGDSVSRLGMDDGLGSVTPTDILADAEGSVWVVTDRGLDRFRPAPFTQIGRREGLPFDVPLGVVVARDGAVWTMDYSTLETWRLDGGVVRSGGGAMVARRRPGHDVLIAAGGPTGVWRQDLHTDRVALDDGRTVRPVDPRGLAWVSPRRGLEGGDGSLWLTWGAARFGRVRDFRFEPVSLGDSTRARRVASLASDGAGRLWISVEPRGVVVVEGDSVREAYEDAEHLPGGGLRLVVERGDTLWAASTHTLVRLAGGAVSRVDVPQLRTVLASGTARLLTSRSHLWIANEEGIGRMQLSALHAAADGKRTAPTVEWINDLDGTSAARTHRTDPLPAATGPDGRLWFATPRGLAVVDPERMPRNEVPPTPLIEEVVLDGRPLALTPGGEIPARPERLTIHFTATSLRLPERVRLEYRLEGADAGWIRASAGRVAEYTGLRPGRYTFSVRAWNEDGVMSAEAATMGFEVLPAFDQRISVRVGMALLAVASIAWLSLVVVRQRHGAMEARTRERYEAVLVERTRLARELHDTLLQGFTGLTLQLHALHARLPNVPTESADELSRIMALADTTLREARDSVWDMRTPELDGPDLPTALERLMERSLAGGAISARASVEGVPRPLPVEFDTTILRVARECLANVSRHAQARVVTVTLAYEPTTVALVVRDDGVGFDASLHSAVWEDGHWGLKGMRERARRVGATLEVISAPGAGTTVRMVMRTP